MITPEKDPEGAARLMTMGCGAIYALLGNDIPTVAAVADEIKRLGIPADDVAVWFATSAAQILAHALGENLAIWYASGEVREVIRREATQHFA